MEIGLNETHYVWDDPQNRGGPGGIVSHNGVDRVEPTAVLGAWMSAVADVVRAVNAAEPLDDLLDRIAEQACQLIGFDYCAVMLADPTVTWLLVRGSHGLSPRYVSAVNREHTIVIQAEAPEDDTAAARTYRDGVTSAVPDIGAAEAYGATRRWAAEQEFGALLAAPLHGPQGPAGVVVGYLGRPRRFDKSEIELVELLAQHAMLALETADLRAVQEETINELSHKRWLLERAEFQHRQLMQILVDEAGLQRMAETLADILQASITVEDVDGTVLALGATDGDAQPPPGRWRKRAEVRSALRMVRERYEVAPIESHGPDGPGWIAPVVLGRQLVGRVWGTRIASLPSPDECRLIERFALVVAVELFKQRYRVETEARLVGDLVEILMRAGAAALPRATVERAAALGHDLSGPQALAVIVSDLHPRRIAEVVRAHGLSAPRPLVGVHEDTVIVVVPADPNPMEIVTELHHRVVASAEGQPVTTVLGPRVTGRFADAFAAARGAARLVPRGSGLVDLRELGLLAHLLRVDVTPELREFVDGVLGPLEGYDARGVAQLCDTLRAWLEAGCSVPAAARALTVHPNTVAYRLSRAEELLGRSLRAMSTRMDLQLGFTIRDIQQATAAG